MVRVFTRATLTAYLPVNPSTTGSEADDFGEATNPIESVEEPLQYIVPRPFAFHLRSEGLISSLAADIKPNPDLRYLDVDSDTRQVVFDFLSKLCGRMLSARLSLFDEGFLYQPSVDDLINRSYLWSLLTLIVAGLASKITIAYGAGTSTSSRSFMAVS